MMENVSKIVPEFRMLAADDVRAILNASFRVLDQRGVHARNQTILDRLKKAGAVVDEDGFTARLSRSMVEDAIASYPSVITLYSRDGHDDVELVNLIAQNQTSAPADCSGEE